MKAPEFNLKPLLEAVNGDAATMSQLLDVFISTCETDLRSLHEAIARQDATAVRATAHHLKGSLLELDARSLVNMALRLEQMGAAQNLQAADALWIELEANLGRLIQVLNKSEYRRTA